MKIFYITDISLDPKTAPTIHVDAICRQFTKLGHEVTLYAPRESFSAAYPVCAIPAPRTLRSLFYQPQLLLRLLWDIARHAPDLIFVRHSHLLIAPLVARLFDIPLCLEVNGILEQDAQHINETLRSRLLLQSGIFALLEKINARASTRVIAVTDGIADYFVSRYGVKRDKIRVIYNGVDTDFFKPTGRQEARQSLGIPHDVFVVGYVGSLHAWQGVHYLLESAKLLIHRADIRFVVIGRGEEKERLQEYIVQNKLTNVDLRDAIAHNEVPRAISAFDVCVCYPLRFRDGATSPFKIYEYLACARPVLAADLPSLRREYGDVLLYAQAESPEALARAIALAAKSDVGKYGTLGRHFVEQGHSWESVAHRILSA